MSVRIIFMGTPDFALPSLAALLANGYQVEAVVTQPDRPKGRGKKISAPPVKQWAANNGISQIWQPYQLDSNFFQKLVEVGPELIVTVAYGCFLPQKVLSLPPLGCINLHASLLPAYRGAAPIHRAIINGETETGVTVQYMAEEMDAGDIILQERFPIRIDDTVGRLHDLLAHQGSRLLLRAVSLLEKGEVVPIPQDETKATYAPLLKRAEEIINWYQPACQIYNWIRGMDPWPGVYTFLKDKEIKIWKARLPNFKEITGKISEPGKVLSIEKEGVLVGTADGVLLIMEVQPSGRRRMTALDFAHGYHLQKGDLFGSH